jgi:hypothetical protein
MENNASLLLGKSRNSKKQGDKGLAIAIYWFEMNGYPVLLPLTDSQDYDLAIDMGHRLCKVQVRTTYHRRETGAYVVNLLVSGGNRSGTGKVKHFNPECVDYLFVVVDNGAKYLIPSDKIESRRSIHVSNNGKYEQFKVE